MKYFLIGAIIIYVIIVTNLIVCAATITVNDYLWQQYVTERIEQTEYDTFSAMHRDCHSITDNSNLCNVLASKVYRLYQKNMNPLPGFDFDLITMPDEKESY